MIYENTGVFVLRVEQQSESDSAADHAFPGFKKKDVVTSRCEGGDFRHGGVEKHDGMRQFIAVEAAQQYLREEIARVLLNMIGDIIRIPAERAEPDSEPSSGKEAKHNNVKICLSKYAL
jgi:hypothetical protein